MDFLTKRQRSRLMGRIRGKDTRPEMILRSALHRIGRRFRLHVRDLPGTPDLVFPGPKKVVFVHGCFWHRHRCRAGTAVPKTNRRFWTEKFRRNVERHRRQASALRRRGWRVLTVWECQLAPPRRAAAVARTLAFLDA